MLGLRFTIDAHPRLNSGQPAHTTTGVARVNWAHALGFDSMRIRSGAVSIAAVWNRRHMSTSSGFSTASAVTVTGSSAMPQMGQLPGPGRMTWGCIGQVYWAAFIGSTAGAPLQ